MAEDDDDDIRRIFEGRAYARHSDPGTSHDAAESIDTTALELAVYTAIHKCGKRGATWDELEIQTGINKASISPRFKPLRMKGLICTCIEKDGKDVKRPGKSGRGQLVWYAVAHTRL